MKKREEVRMEVRTEEMARQNSGGDTVLEEIFLMNLHYNWGKGRNPRKPRIDEPHVVNGVKFWCVGHNASHEFYVGTDGNGKRFRYSVGDSCTLDVHGMPLTEDGIPGVDGHFQEVTYFRGYFGHF